MLFPNTPRPYSCPSPPQWVSTTVELPALSQKNPQTIVNAVQNIFEVLKSKCDNSTPIFSPPLLCCPKLFNAAVLSLSHCIVQTLNPKQSLPQTLYAELHEGFIGISDGTYVHRFIFQDGVADNNDALPYKEIQARQVNTGQLIHRQFLVSQSNTDGCNILGILKNTENPQTPCFDGLVTTPDPTTQTFTILAYYNGHVVGRFDPSVDPFLAPSPQISNPEFSHEFGPLDPQNTA